MNFFKKRFRSKNIKADQPNANIDHTAENNFENVQSNDIRNNRCM